MVIDITALMIIITRMLISSYLFLNAYHLPGFILNILRSLTHQIPTATPSMVVGHGFTPLVSPVNSKVRDGFPVFQHSV